MRACLLRPIRETVVHENQLAVDALKAHWPGVTDMPLVGVPNIDQARAILATRAVSAGMDLAIWIDSDVAFIPSELERMAKEATERSAVVGAVYTTKQPLGRLTAGGLPEDVTFFEGGEVLRVPWIPFGLVAMPVGLFTWVCAQNDLRPLRIDGEPRPVFPAWMPFPIDGGYPSDDKAFCKRCELANVPVFADTRVRVMHFGRYGYRIEDALAAVTARQSLRVVVATGTLPSGETPA